MKKQYRILAVFLILLLGGGLRAYRLGFQSLWNDEVITYRVSSSAPWTIVSNPPNDVNIPPLYYLIIHYVIKFGDQELLLRLASMIFGSLSILVFYLVLSNLTGNNTGLISATVLAISPFHVWYSQEARGYALLLFLSLLTLWLLQELIKRQEKIWLKLSFVFFTALTFYCHTVTIAFIGFMWAYIMLVIPQKKWKEWLPLFGAVLILIAPAIYRFLMIPPSASANTFQAFSPLFAPYTLWAFGRGYSLGPTLNELHGLDPIRMRIVLSYFPIIFPVMLFFCVLLLLGVLQLRKRNKLLFRITALWFILPLIFAILGSIITVHAFNVRYAMLSFPAFVVFVTAGIQFFREKWANRFIFAIIGIIFILSLKNYFFDDRYYRDDNRAAGRFLSAYASPNDLVLVSAAYTSDNLRYYYQGTPVNIVGYPQKMNQVETGARFIEPSRVEKDLDAILRERKQFWLFLSRTYHSDPQGYILNYCNLHFIREREMKGSGVELVFYKKRVNNNLNNSERTEAGFEGLASISWRHSE